jgi:hypothetical protein
MELLDTGGFLMNNVFDGYLVEKYSNVENYDNTTDATQQLLAGYVFLLRPIETAPASPVAGTINIFRQSPALYQLSTQTTHKSSGDGVSFVQLTDQVNASITTPSLLAFVRLSYTNSTNFKIYGYSITIIAVL